MARWTSRQGTITLEDANGESITAGPGQGDLNVSNWTADNKEFVRAMDRGAFDGHFHGSDSEQEVSFTLELEDQSLTHASNARIMDWILNKRKGATNLVSTNPNTDVWSCKLKFTMIKGAVTSTITLPVFTPRLDFSEAGADAPMTISLQGTNNGAVVLA